MSIFSWFRNPFRPIVALDHPEIGEVITISRLENGNFYWESKKEIEVGSHTVLLVFVAPEIGPSAGQLGLWRHVTNHMSMLSNRGREFIKDELGNGHHLLAGNRSDDTEDFAPSLVALPEPENTKQMWSMSFEIGQNGHVVAVEFEGNKPVSFEVN